MAVKKKTKTRAKTSVKRKAVKKTAVKRKAVKKTVRKTAVKKTVKKAKKKTKTKRKGGAGGLSKLSYTLSEELQAVVGCKSATRPEIVKKLWAYIKAHKCQDAKNRRMINPDAKLSKVIGSKSVDMMKLAGHISKHVK